MPFAKAGVRRVRLHDGRHSAATMLLEDGTPVHIVSQMLGHSKPSITLDVYATLWTVVASWRASG